ncbi:DUF6083 domain-containing protein [Streptomyces venezuelae]|uniref:DUF6083 domain-containing protein n=1 Tax=Streptomyces venezuelae TaxID=54571 RepID=UPI0037D8E448
MGSGRRSDECDSCGTPYGTWVPSLGMALCRGCERAGAGQAARDPVLVGEVLAGLVDAARFEVRGGSGVPERRHREAVRDLGAWAVVVPEPRHAEAVRELGAGSVVVPEPRLPEAVRDLGAGSVVVPEPRLPEAVRDLGPGPVVVPEPRSGGSSPGPAGPATSPCRRCGARAEWLRTVRGRWILIEPGDLPARAVPAGSRWRVAGEGTAVQLGAALPSDTCRVSHFDVCAAAPAPVGSPALLALWRGHARRIA